MRRIPTVTATRPATVVQLVVAAAATELLHLPVMEAVPLRQILTVVILATTLLALLRVHNMAEVRSFQERILDESSFSAPSSGYSYNQPTSSYSGNSLSLSFENKFRNCLVHLISSPSSSACCFKSLLLQPLCTFDRVLRPKYPILHLATAELFSHQHRHHRTHQQHPPTANTVPPAKVNFPVR